MFTLHATESDDAHTGVPATDGALPGINVEAKESRSRFQQSHIADQEQHQDAARPFQGPCSTTLPLGVQTNLKSV